MTYHKIDFDFAGSPCEKRMRPMIAPPPSSVSFGWGDFPVIVAEEFPPMDKLSSAQPSDVTESTLEIEFEDDTLADSELGNDDEETTMLADGILTNDRPRRQVSFDLVEIREYNVVLGVHPLASGGFPLELGWEYNESQQFSVDEYELERSCCPYSGQKVQRLSAIERQYKLAQVSGCTLMEIISQEELRQQEATKQIGASHSINENDDIAKQTQQEQTVSGQQMLRSATLDRLIQYI